MVLAKKGGPLTKQICLTEEGKLRSDGSACVMSRGVAQRALSTLREKWPKGTDPRRLSQGPELATKSHR
jgi:hypothetical protein